MMRFRIFGVLFLLLVVCGQSAVWAQDIPIQRRIERVQPFTGLVLWDDSEHRDTDAIQLEFSYLRYEDIIRGAGDYDWVLVDKKLAAIAGRGHQAIFRFYFTYPGKSSAVPAYVKKIAGYVDTQAMHWCQENPTKLCPVGPHKSI